MLSAGATWQAPSSWRAGWGCGAGVGAGLPDGVGSALAVADGVPVAGAVAVPVVADTGATAACSVPWWRGSATYTPAAATGTQTARAASQGRRPGQLRADAGERCLRGVVTASASQVGALTAPSHTG